MDSKDRLRTTSALTSSLAHLAASQRSEIRLYGSASCREMRLYDSASLLLDGWTSVLITHPGNTQIAVMSKS